MRAAVLAIVLAGAIAVGLLAPAGQARPRARSASDLCTLWAPSKADVEKVFGKGERQAPIAEKEFCYVEGVTGAVKIYPYPARRARAEQSLWQSGLASFGRRVTRSHPAHLGAGATMLRTPKNDEIALWFTRGRHFIVISKLLGGTPAQIVAFAKLVYAKA